MSTPQTESPVNFLKPVLVETETSISAPAGESVPLILHQRDNAHEEWKETEHLTVGERNKVDFKMQRGEAKITINLQEWKKKLANKIRRLGKRIVKYFRIKVHTRVGFYVHMQTGQIALTFGKDQNIHEMSKRELREGNFISLSLISHIFSAKLGTEVTLMMECKVPAESKISDEVLPSPSFMVDRNFLANGRHTVYFELDPEPSNHCDKIKLIYGCSLDGEIDHRLPLKAIWPQKEMQRKQLDSHNAPVYNAPVGQNFNAPVAQVAGECARIVSHGDNYFAGSEQAIDTSTTAGNVYHGRADVGTVGGSVNVTRRSSGRTEVTEAEPKRSTTHDSHANTSYEAQSGFRQCVDQPVVAATIYEGEASVNTEGENITVTQN